MLKCVFGLIEMLTAGSHEVSLGLDHCVIHVSHSVPAATLELCQTHSFAQFPCRLAVLWGLGDRRGASVSVPLCAPSVQLQLRGI